MARDVRNVENFYSGLFRPPEYMPETTFEDIFVGYRVPAGKLGATTSIRTANQIAEVTSRLNTGMKVVEAQPLEFEVFEQIPQQHFKEINRLAKLTGAEITWHAPLIDPAGMQFTEGGGFLKEEARKNNEEMLWEVIKKAGEAVGGKRPITIHSTSGIYANEIKVKKDGKEEIEALGVVNRLNDSLNLLKIESLLTPKEIIEFQSGKIEVNPYELIERKNRESWGEIIARLERRKLEFEPHIIQYPKSGVELLENKLNELKESYALAYLGKPISKLSEKEKKELDEILSKQEEYNNYLRSVNFQKIRARESETLFKDIVEETQHVLKIAWDLSDEEKRKKIINFIDQLEASKKIFNENPQQALNHVSEVLNELRNPELIPKILVPAEDFAREKASETLSNLAIKAYEHFKDNAPIISIENFFPDRAFSRADSLRKLIEETREKFVEKMKDKIGEEKAKKLAEELIGVTWDIGHINLLRRYGFSPEEITHELKEIKPFIKHFHITDNFGFTDSHLPPGMGGIPKEVFKEISEIIEKQGSRGVIEAATLPIGFGVSPYPYSLAALGSPLYSYEMAPFWNQALAAGVPAYFTGYGPILPEQHFAMYGGGFAGVPFELGGQTVRKREEE